MGSILAETIESEHIDKLVAPVKDLFGAIFFVSVGMMVDPNMIVEYIWPILAIVVAILVGQFLIVQFGGPVFRTEPLDGMTWLAIIASSSLVLWVGEIVRLVRRLMQKKQ